MANFATINEQQFATILAKVLGEMGITVTDGPGAATNGGEKGLTVPGKPGKQQTAAQGERMKLLAVRHILKSGKAKVSWFIGTLRGQYLSNLERALFASAFPLLPENFGKRTHFKQSNVPLEGEDRGWYWLAPAPPRLTSGVGPSLWWLEKGEVERRYSAVMNAAEGNMTLAQFSQYLSTLDEYTGWSAEEIGRRLDQAVVEFKATTAPTTAPTATATTTTTNGGKPTLAKDGAAVKAPQAPKAVAIPF